MLEGVWMCQEERSVIEFQQGGGVTRFLGGTG
jgi:hypothetical protein